MGFFWRSAATLAIVLVVSANDWGCELIVDSVLCSSWELMAGVVGAEILNSSSFWVAVVRSAIVLVKLIVFLDCSAVMDLMKSCLCSRSLISGWPAVRDLLISVFKSSSEI